MFFIISLICSSFICILNLISTCQLLSFVLFTIEIGIDKIIFIIFSSISFSCFDLKLNPLIEFIKQANCTLEGFHYDIIEEVYEILSRYSLFDNTYEYKHNLLEIFLEKQLKYLVYFTIEDKTEYIKVFQALLETCLIEIDLIEQKKCYIIYKQEKDLTAMKIEAFTPQEYKERVVYENARHNILRISYESISSKTWLTKYINSITKLIKMFTFYKDYSSVHEKLQSEILKLEKTIQSFINENTSDELYKNYMDLLLIISDSYFFQEDSRFLDFESKCENIIYKLYEQDSNKWYKTLLEFIKRKASTQNKSKNYPNTKIAIITIDI